VIAPPGFGKTSLLSDWSERDDRAFAWLSVGKPDNDRTVLWTYIAAALARSRRQALERFTGLAREQDPVEAFVRELDADEELVLVLDDYHVIENDDCHASVMRLVETAPRQLQVVISSRVEPPLAIARLRAGGRLLELDATDLAFSSDETEAFLNGSLGLALDREAVAVLHERTEGWPAGLYLAYLSLRNAKDRRAFISTFGALNRNVGDYLTEQVLSSLEPDELEFMLRTSIVDELSGSLADVLTDRRDSANRLNELERANVFLTPLDDRREWYRYHHLLSELLRVELRRHSPDAEPELHLRASEWFEDAGDADRAIHHAIEAGDLERAAPLISRSYLQALEWGRLETIAIWLERIGDKRVASDPRLAIVKAWVMHFLGRHADGEAALAAALGSSYEGVLPDGASSIEASAALMGAAFPGGDVEAMLADARRAYELESYPGSPWRTTVHVLLGFALVRNGEFREADRYLELGGQMASRSGMWMDAVGARSLQAKVQMEIGDRGLGERYARDAIAIADAHGVTSTAAGAFARAVLGDTLVQNRRPSDGAALLEDAVPDLRILGEPLPLAEALLALATARGVLGARHDAMAAFGEATALINAMPSPGYLATTRQSVAKQLEGSPESLDGPLSPREVEVLRLLAQGMTKREVAAQLFVSYNTVHSHVRSIYRKLGVASRRAAVERANDQAMMG
jgi:LuxR family maltose regulon positive regulatory protein